MKRSVDVVVQQGHVPRMYGTTGTAGVRGTEQAFALEIGPRITQHLRAAGLTVALIGADDPRPTAEVFLALHQDGSDDPGARGASVGYPRYGDGATLAKIFKARYTLAGWPNGFRADNNTIGLHWYYGFGWNRYSKRLARFDAALLIEHGFATTVLDVGSSRRDRQGRRRHDPAIPRPSTPTLERKRIWYGDHQRHRNVAHVGGLDIRRHDNSPRIP